MLARLAPVLPMTRSASGALRPLLPPPVVTRSQHVPGTPHALDTVKQIAKFIEEGGRDYTVRQWATRAIDRARVPWRDKRGEMQALHHQLVRDVRYTSDPLRQEMVQRPVRTLAEGHGDCDDFAALLGAAMESVGIPVRLRIVGPQHGAYRHVHVEGRDQHGEWIAVDPVLLPRRDFPARPRGAGMLFDGRTGTMVGFGAAAHPGDRALWRGTPDAFPALSGVVELEDGEQLDLEGLGWAEEIEEPEHGELALGYDEDGDLAVLEFDGMGSFWSAIKKIGSTVAHAVSSVASSPIARIAAGIIPGGSAILTAAGTAAQAVSRFTSSGAPAAPTAARPAAAAAPVRLPTVVQAPGAGTASLHAPIRPGTIVGGTAASRAAAARGISPEMAARMAAAPVHAAIPSAATAALHARSYPAEARQWWDAEHRTFRVYLPVVGFQGLGGGITAAQARSSPYYAIVGSRPWGLGGLGAVDPVKAQLLAPAAISWVVAHASNLRMVSPEIRAFQVAAGLRADGMYGPNTYAALQYYGGAAALVLPARSGATWRPPATPLAPAPVPMTAAAPASSTPAPVTFTPGAVTAPPPTVRASPPPTTTTAIMPGATIGPSGFREIAQQPTDPGLPSLPTPPPIAIPGAPGPTVSAPPVQPPTSALGPMPAIPPPAGAQPPVTYQIAPPARTSPLVWLGLAYLLAQRSRR